LNWQVWEPKAGQHQYDPDLASVDAIVVISFVGRAATRTNHSACGEYEIAGVHHGKPWYRQRNGEHEIRFYIPDGRWMVVDRSCTGNMCLAFADGPHQAHPGDAALVWHFFETLANNFQTDPAVKALPCPLFVHVIGRQQMACNGQINGSYEAIGAVDGRPMFLQPGTRKLLRYSAKCNRWLIQCDGPVVPSIMSKIYHWLFAGGSVAEDRCSAFAQDVTAPHPGFCELEWHVFEDRFGEHRYDPNVRSTTAPLAVQVIGRDHTRENGSIVGEYLLCGTHGGRPAYVKPNSTIAIRYWLPMHRWIIDLQGLRMSDCCTAFVDDPGRVSEDPTRLRTWHVFSKSRGCHTADPNLVVVEAENGPRSFPAVDSRVLVPKRALEPRWMEAPEAKRARPIVGFGTHGYATLGA